MAEIYVLGLDIGGTNIRMGLVNRNGEVFDVRVLPSKRVYESGDTPFALCAVIAAYLSEYGKRREVAVISAGFPSVLDRKREKILSSTNLTGLDGINIVRYMEEKLGIRTVIEHDAYYLLRYDMKQRGVEREGVSIGLYYGTGMGNAMFIDGKPFYGKHGTACELGHIALSSAELLCSCGNTGCIEMRCCGKALERIWKECFPEAEIGMLFEKYAETKVLKDFVDCMAIAASAEINIIDPDYIFLGGGLVNMKGFPKEYLSEQIVAHTRKPYPAEDLELIYTPDFPEKGILGAAAAAFYALQ